MDAKTDELLFSDNRAKIAPTSLSKDADFRIDLINIYLFAWNYLLDCLFALFSELVFLTFPPLCVCDMKEENFVH